MKLLPLDVFLHIFMKSITPSKVSDDREQLALERTLSLPRQTLQDIVQWGNTFLKKAQNEKELTELYGSQLVSGCMAIAQWWQTLSENQCRAFEALSLVYCPLPLASKFSKLPLQLLDDCLAALQKQAQKAQLTLNQITRTLNQFIAKTKLHLGEPLADEHWYAIQKKLALNNLELKEIQQQAKQLAEIAPDTGDREIHTETVVEILKERGYQTEQLQPKPKIKRYSPAEVEQIKQEQEQELREKYEQQICALKTEAFNLAKEEFFQQFIQQNAELEKHYQQQIERLKSEIESLREQMEKVQEQFAAQPKAKKTKNFLQEIHRLTAPKMAFS